MQSDLQSGTKEQVLISGFVKNRDSAGKVHERMQKKIGLSLSIHGGKGETMKRRWNLFFAAIFIFAIGLFVSSPYSVQADNPTEVRILPETVYQNYDITGDKKTDKILIHIFEDNQNQWDTSYTGVSISVNETECYSFSGKVFFDIDAKLYTLKNGRPFLYLYCQSDNGDGPVCGLFQYKEGKLKKVINFQNLITGGSHPYGEIIKINGNKIVAQFYLMSYTLGPSWYRYRYIYKNGTLKRTDKIGTVYKVYSFGKPNKIFKAAKSIPVYHSVKAKKIAFTLGKGNRVTTDKIYRGANGTMLRIKYKGTYGWIKCAENSLDTNLPIFSNVSYVG